MPLVGPLSESPASSRTPSLTQRLRTSTRMLMQMERRPAHLLLMCTLMIVKWLRPVQQNFRMPSQSNLLQRRAMEC